MRRTLTLAFIAGALMLTPLALRADILNETFTVPITADTTLPATPFPSGLTLFNPADGTLTGITVSVSGAATWTSSYSSPLLLANLYDFSNPSSGESFNTPGTITFNLTGTSTDGATLAEFTGTGNDTGGLLELNVSQLETGDTIAASIPLAGTITYDYTPAATTATPECCSFLLFGTGLIGLALAIRKRSRQQRAARAVQMVRSDPSPRSLALPQGLAAQRS